ncbi:hypothetical protein KQX54_018134 [Cotesia glomerata]|uniref:BTB domain-containing protein n=1 Tax=Cotesia glomerata TaxID=32391 RepID=A0AAV7IWQ3_COTGL|nr:hypothetical protein KQX54_018134 [Cotesia glomerata]
MMRFRGSTILKELSDVTIIVNQVRIPAHKVVLAAHSEGTTKASYDFLTALQVLEVADIYQFIKLKKICEVTLGGQRCLLFSIVKLLASGEFKELFFRKHELVYEIVQALGDL